jgi:hypothetical protein
MIIVMSAAPTADELARASYLRLTTFKRDGTPVPTPVWVVSEGPTLLVITPPTTGKVKRLRHTPRVLLAVCDWRGRVAPGTPEAEGTATVVTDPAAVHRLGALIVRKYGVLARVLHFVERRRGIEPVRLEITLA